MSEDGWSDPQFGDRLTKFINEQVSLVDDDLEGETDLLLLGAVDSLGVIRITQWIEDELDTEVDPTDVTLENFQTISKMLAYCETKGA